MTRLEVARELEAAASAPRAPDLPADLVDTLGDLFPAHALEGPDPAVARLLAVVLATADEPLLRPLAALVLRRPLLAAVAALGTSGPAPLDILRPGERVLLGTARGRDALEVLLAGRIEPLAAWVRTTVLDADAFVATTWDVPLADVRGLERLVGRLAAQTELLPPGGIRAQVAREWISELVAQSLDDAVPFADVVRVVGEGLLRCEAPVLLWHAVQQLAVVVEGDQALARAVLRRCLPVAGSEVGHVPAAAAAPFLGQLSPRQAAALLDELAPALSPAAWSAISSSFLADAFRRSWRPWREHVRRWAQEDDAGRALAAVSGIRAAGVREPGVLDWFTAAPSSDVRRACRHALSAGAA